MRYNNVLTKIAEIQLTGPEGVKPGSRYEKSRDYYQKQIDAYSDDDPKVKQYKDLWTDVSKDMEEEYAADVNKDFGKQLSLRLPGYLAVGAGFGGLGALIAGKKRRLLGWLIGGGIGLGANFWRRKSWYGDTVKW